MDSTDPESSPKGTCSDGFTAVEGSGSRTNSLVMYASATTASAAQLPTIRGSRTLPRTLVSRDFPDFMRTCTVNPHQGFEAWQLLQAMKSETAIPPPGQFSVANSERPQFMIAAPLLDCDCSGQMTVKL